MSSEPVLSTLICRNLQDRSYERRKQGALAIEALVRQKNQEARVLATRNGLDPSTHDARTRSTINQMISFLVNNFIKSTQANHRKGGLIGLAGVALGLGTQTALYLDAMLPAVCSLLGDQEARVRYYACESLYNICKAAQYSILDHFDRIFDGLCMLFEDVDSHVKEASALLDRLIKEFVSNCAERFVLGQFVPRLRVQMNKTNPFVRELILQWIILLNNTPGIELLDYLPKFLDGLFEMLEDGYIGPIVRREPGAGVVGGSSALDSSSKAHAPLTLEAAGFIADSGSVFDMDSAPEGTVGLVGASGVGTSGVIGGSGSGASSGTGGGAGGPGMVADEQTQEIVKQTELVLADFLREISGSIHVDLRPMVSIVILQMKNVRYSTRRRLYGLLWLNEMIKLGKFKLIPFYPDILIALLQCIHDDDPNISTQSRKVSAELHALVKRIGGLPNTRLFNEDKSKSSFSSSQKKKKKKKKGGVSDDSSMILEEEEEEATAVSVLPPASSSLGGCSPSEVEEKVYELMEILCMALRSEFVATRIAALEWVCMVVVHLNVDIDLVNSRIRLFPVLLTLLCDSDINVLNLTLTVLSQMSVKPRFFHAILLNLLLIFKDSGSLLATRGKYILEKMCELLGARNVYVHLSEKLVSDERISYDLRFCSLVIQSLNLMLFTTDSPCLEELRYQIRNCKSNEDSWSLFVSLFEPWCYNPVATLGLALLGQVYDLSAKLVLEFAHTDITVGVLMGIDKLISLIESPSLIHLRMQLLEPRRYPFLLKTLYGLLMLLPQNSAFNALRIRLHSASSFGMMDCSTAALSAAGGTGSSSASSSESDAKSSPSFATEDETNELFRKYVAFQTRYKSKKVEDITAGSLIKDGVMPGKSDLTGGIPSISSKDVSAATVVAVTDEVLRGSKAEETIESALD